MAKTETRKVPVQQSRHPLVGVVMGSQSDWPTMRYAVEILDRLGIRREVRIVSAHRTPERLRQYGQTAAGRGLMVIIAGAGGAAHLPGMLAAYAYTTIVLGVPIESAALKGLDSLLSIVQMPGGIPVPTLAIGKAGAINAALSAAAIVGVANDGIGLSLKRWREELTNSVAEAPYDEVEVPEPRKKKTRSKKQMLPKKKRRK